VETAQESTAVNQQSPTDAFRDYLDENYAVDMARAPYTASYRGIKTHHDKCNSVAETHLEETRRISETRLLQLGSFDRKAMDESSGLSWDIYRTSLQRLIAELEVWPEAS
jgi:uncharacterized protein (DUF885 family)